MICIDTFISSMTEDRGVVGFLTGWMEPNPHQLIRAKIRGESKKRKKPIGSEELCEVWTERTS